MFVDWETVLTLWGTGDSISAGHHGGKGLKQFKVREHTRNSTVELRGRAWKDRGDHVNDSEDTRVSE